MDEWNTQWEPETVNRWNQSLSLIQAVWAVVLIAVATGSAIANAHLRVVQLEWRQEADQKAGAEWRTDVQATLKAMGEQLREIDIKLARMEAPGR